jgi:formylglycine-generating enzyme required for sulfatase activity
MTDLPWRCSLVVLGAAASCGGLVDGARESSGGGGGPLDVGDDSRVVGEMVSIAAGTFVMGSDHGAEHQLAAHEVEVEAFSIDVTEVTGEAYLDCIEAGVCPSREERAYSELCDLGVAGREQVPVFCVSADEAAQYCTWVNKRLPTEEEWEYAARGTDGRTFPWGDEVPYDQVCWSGGSAGLRDLPCAVGSFPSGDSPFGVADMAGGVWEWTSSPFFDETSGEFSQTFRGGAWTHTEPAFLLASGRYGGAPTEPFFGTGIRCARSAK